MKKRKRNDKIMYKSKTRTMLSGLIRRFTLSWKRMRRMPRIQKKLHKENSVFEIDFFFNCK